MHDLTRALAAGLRAGGCRLAGETFFDTLRVTPGTDAASVLAAARERGFNLRDFDDGSLGVALDETTTPEDVAALVVAFTGRPATRDDVVDWAAGPAFELPDAARRRSEYLSHAVFHRYRTEHELLRYIHRLQARDLSLTTSMIPLGSCTMKLNATSEMLPVTWPEFGRLHPYAPVDQSAGYAKLLTDLETWLAEITELPAVSLQPNAGSQGEFAGLLAIRRYHDARGDTQRDVCLIPVSAHGTNAASAVTAGFRCVPV